MTTSASSLSEDVEQFYREAQQDDLGLWEIVHVAEERLDTPDNVRAEVCHVVRTLLSRGVLIGTLTQDGGFAPWDEQQADPVITRVEREWQDLGDDFGIGDIAYFCLPR